MNKKVLLKKTVLVGGLTLLSRFLGIVREVLLLRFLGIGLQSDSFLTAWRLPNFFRKIFAEGSLSAALVPSFVTLLKKNEREKLNSLMTVSFLFFGGIIVTLSLCVIAMPETVVRFIAPGFSHEQVVYTAPLIRLLFLFIFFVSSSNLLAGALQSVHHFLVPALSMPLLNVFWIIVLLLCLYNGYSMFFLCYGILVAGAIQLFLHGIMYWIKGFSWGPVTVSAFQEFVFLLRRFCACLLGASVLEVNAFIDGVIGSFLSKGSITILYYGGRFVHIPLGMFAIALSTTLLPHFSRIVLYAPRRMRYYILEIAKLVTWAMLPVAFFLAFHADIIFSMFLPPAKSTLVHNVAARWALTIYAGGLVFFSLNKIFMSMLYAYKDAYATMMGFFVSVATNILCSSLGACFFDLYGIALATVTSSIALMVYLVYILYRRHNIVFYLSRYMVFLKNYGVQLLCGMFVYLFMHYLCFFLLQDSFLYHFFYESIGYWLFSFFNLFLMFFFFYLTKKMFKVRLYFL